MRHVGFLRRLFAFLIDILPITLLLFGVWYFFLDFDSVIDAWRHNPGSVPERQHFLQSRNQIRDTSFLLWIFYAAIMECSSWQATIGKKIMGIKVTDYGGKRLTILRSISRNLGKILSYLPLSLGFVWSLFSKKKQCWHDMLAKTYVLESSVDSISSLSIEESSDEWSIN